MPSITGGDVRQIGMTIIPSYFKWVSDVSNLDANENDMKELNSDWVENVNIGTKDTPKMVNRIKIDKKSIPEERQKYFVSENFIEAVVSGT